MANITELQNAYRSGRAAFLTGLSEPAKGTDEISVEFRRGYMMTRKDARRTATWKAKRAVKPIV